MTTLLDVLRERRALLEGEDQMLLAPDARDLPAQAQLAYLTSNRKVGRFVTGLAGGVRLFLLAGALLGHVILTLDGELPFAWWSLLVWLGLGALLAWLAGPFVRRMRELGRPLPMWSEIEPELTSHARG